LPFCYFDKDCCFVFYLVVLCESLLVMMHVNFFSMVNIMSFFSSLGQDRVWDFSSFILFLKLHDFRLMRQQNYHNTCLLFGIIFSLLYFACYRS
jgi:hypothetical protein